MTTGVAKVLTNRSAPPATVTPVLVCPDVRAAVAGHVTHLIKVRVPDVAPEGWGGVTVAPW